MDERERTGAERRRSERERSRRQRPDRYAHRSPGGGSSQRRQKPGRPEPNRSGSGKRSSRARRRRRNAVIRWLIFIILILAVIGGILVWKRYGASNEKANLEQYYGIDQEDEIAVVVNEEVVREDDEASSGNTEPAPAPGKVYDGQYYIEYSVVRERINKRFYWDPNENILLYTLPDGNVSAEVGSSEYTDITEKKSVDYTILKTEGRTAYIALPFIQEYTNMEYEVYDDPGPSRVVITSVWGEIQTAEIKRDTQVRYQGGVKSPILTEISGNSKVVVLEDENDWMKVGTEDGFIGYVKTNTLKNITTETRSREFEEPVYTNISKNCTINMA